MTPLQNRKPEGNVVSDSNPWWNPLLRGVISAVLMSLVMGWLARSRKKPPQADSRQLTYPRSVFTLGLVSALLFLTCAFFAFRSPTGGALVSAFFLCFAVMGAYMLVEYVTTSYVAREAGLEYTTLLRRGFAAWSEISEVRFSPSMKWFVLRMRDGKTLRISALMLGLPVFAEAVLAEASHMVIDDDSLRLLRETSIGNPPSVWN
jgi:hypothetical protein